MLDLLLGLLLILWLGKKILFSFLQSSFFTVDNWTHKAVIITGCDSGFGAALARALDARGVPVFACCLTEEGKTRIREECSKKLIPILLDVTEEDSLRKCKEFVRDTLKNSDLKLWGLVSNAGVMGSFLPFELTSYNEFHSLMAVNYFGAVGMIRAFLDLIIESRGRIAVTTSIQGQVPAPCLSAYSASKYALHAFCQVLQIELENFNTGVRVSVIQPSGYKTNIQSAVNEWRRRSYASITPETRLRYGEDFLIKTVERVEDREKMTNEFLSSDLTPVVDCFTHALFARWPSEQYFSGLLCGTMYRMYRLLPSRIFNYIIVRLYDCASVRPAFTIKGQNGLSKTYLSHVLNNNNNIEGYVH